MNLALLFFLILAMITDVKTTKVRNRLIICGLLCGLVLRILGQGSEGVVIFCFNIFIPIILLYLLFQLRALGAGDIKLFSVVGAFLPTRELLIVILLSFFCGAVLGIMKLCCLHLQKKKNGKYTKIHFSIAITIAYLLQVWGCICG